MRHRHVTLNLMIAGLAISGFAVAGCGGGSPAASAPYQPAASAPHQAADRSLAGMHACQLIPATAIAQALGQLDGVPSESADGLQCIYNTRMSSENAGPTYILDVTRRSAFEVAKTIAQSEANAHLVHLVSVSGVGDEGFAISDTKGEPIYTVNVAKGGAAASIQMNSVQPANERSADRLMGVVISRL